MGFRGGAVAVACIAACAALGVAAACSSEEAPGEEPPIRLPDRRPKDGGPCSKTCLDESTLQDCSEGATKTAPCPLGCNADEARCYRLDPAGATEPEDYATATGALELTAPGTYVIDTGDGAIRGPNGELRGAGAGSNAGLFYRLVDQVDDARFGLAPPKLGVLGVRRLAVGAEATLRVVGARALAIAVAQDAIVDGTISVAGDCDANAPGPGGFAHDDGARRGFAGDVVICGIVNHVILRCGGGSGGGGSGNAGGGGGSSQDGRGGNAGDAYPSLDGGPFILVGGSGGGSAPSNYGGGLGGAGGGALQLAAATSIRIQGTIDASGCGGSLGGNAPNGGAAGGAGGMIVLESPSIAIGERGIVSANGGGGASGAANGNGSAPGAAGAPGIAPAPGGEANNCAGGAGGAVDASAGRGTSCAPPGVLRIAAGGGGAAGRVIVHGVLDATQGSALSPEAAIAPAARR